MSPHHTTRPPPRQGGVAGPSLFPANSPNLDPAPAPGLARRDDLRARNVPQGALGIQGHWEVDRVPLADIAALRNAMKARHLKAMVSGLDLGRGPWHANDGKDRAAVASTDPLAAGCPPDLGDRQARQYADLFRRFADRDVAPKPAYRAVIGVR